jgi:quercetin dioxygenase-like cupin family protein
VLEGAFLFIVDGVEYHVEELDQIFVPVGVRWEYLNASLGQSMFLSMVGP